MGKNFLIMHPRNLGMHIAIDSLLQILSFDMKFFCVNMFPYDDSEIVSLSVCPFSNKSNHPSFVNISPVVLIVIK